MLATTPTSSWWTRTETVSIGGGTPRPDAYPDWSPDGSRIAFHSRFYNDQDNYPYPITAAQIWVASVRGRTITKLTADQDGLNEVEPAWSPDGRWIAFSRFSSLTGINGKPVSSELWIMQPDGTHQRRVGTRPGGEYSFRQVPSWSPDGGSIVFSADGVVVVVDLGSKRVRTFPGTEADVGPSWSPSGILMSRASTASDAVPVRKFRWKRLPLVHLEAGTYFVNVRTGVAVPVPRSIMSIPGAGDYDISPDGTKILFDNARWFTPSDKPIRPGHHQIWVANIDGSRLRQLTDDPAGASQGSWSPDGTKVVYLGGWARLCCWLTPADLTVVDVSTGTTTRLAHGIARAFQTPTFSADGNEVLFTRPGNAPAGKWPSDLWTMPLDGGRPRLLLQDRGYGSFSPNGRTIVFPRLATWQEGNGMGTYAQVWVSEADGRKERILVRSGGGWSGDTGQGRWSPDGRWIFYSTDGDPQTYRRGGLYIRDMSMGRSTLLSEGCGYDWLNDETLLVERRG